MIAIPNMDKPKGCVNCPVNDLACELWTEVANIKTHIHKDCPLIEIDESEMEYLYREFGLEEEENLTNGAKELKRAILMGYLYAKTGEVRTDERITE